MALVTISKPLKIYFSRASNETLKNMNTFLQAIAKMFKLFQRVASFSFDSANF